LSNGDRRATVDSEALRLEGRILRSSGWVALGLGGRQIASFVALFILARLLEPADFGVMALALTVLFLLEQIQETGVGAALIHRRRDIEAAAGSALVYSPLAGVVAYGLVFAAAPLVARFLDAPELVDVLRVMGLVLVIRGLGVVPGAILERSLDFRSRMVAELGAATVQLFLSVGLAFAGFGVWSLVLGSLAAVGTQTALYWVLVPWRPSPRLANVRIFLELMRFGRFVGATSVLTVITNTADNVVVSRVLGTAAVGLYAVAFRLANFPNAVIGHIVGRPMFSIYSTLQDDLDAFRHAYVRNLQRVALFAVPASVGLVIAAEPVVLGLLGEKWLPAVPALRILGVYGLIKSFGSMSVEALKGLGVPHWNVVFGITYVAIVIPALVLFTRSLELEGAALAMLIAVLASSLPAVFLTARKLRLGVRELARALAPSALCSAILALTLVVLVSQSESMSPAASLALLVCVGLAVYVASTALFARSVVVPMWLSVRRGRGPDAVASPPTGGYPPQSR
jgi:lipopolysaccharide exporter